MRTKVLFAVGLTSLVAAAQGQFVDNFSYPDGPLTTATGSPWQLWDPGSSADMNVVGGSRHDRGRFGYDRAVHRSHA